MSSPRRDAALDERINWVVRARLFDGGRLIAPAELNGSTSALRSGEIFHDEALVHFAALVAKMVESGVVQLHSRVAVDEAGQTILDQADGVPDFQRESGRCGDGAVTAMRLASAARATRAAGETQGMLRAVRTKVTRNARRKRCGLMLAIHRYEFGRDTCAHKCDCRPLPGRAHAKCGSE